MKKNLLLVAFGLILSFHVNAQNDLQIGINAGLNYPDIRGNELAKYNNFNVGYLFGISFDYYIKENLSLKSNINYERKIKELRLTYYDQDFEESGSENFRELYDYINLPVLLKYEFLNSKVFVNAGPFINFLVNNTIKPNFPIDDPDGATKLKKIDFGLSAGIGTNISLNDKNDLTIEIRDDFGIIDTGGVPRQIDGTVKTNTIKLILGWNLGI